MSGADPRSHAPMSIPHMPVPLGGHRAPYEFVPVSRQPAAAPRCVMADAPAAPPPPEPDAAPGPDARAALLEACVTLTAMAAALGLPRATLAAYRLGTRRPPAAVRARLAEYLAQRADALRLHAVALAEGTGPVSGSRTAAWAAAARRDAGIGPGDRASVLPSERGVAAARPAVGELHP